mmetsp:Transcript_54572/g.130191  ORF Transcript_54572/g.130191 Transcript_54572/m.130191 type:complete len:308 (+) Transcript_54572:120-1043(+)
MLKRGGNSPSFYRPPQDSEDMSSTPLSRPAGDSMSSAAGKPPASKGAASEVPKIKPEVAEACWKVAAEYGALFPTSASQERMFRRRMAKTSLQLLMRQGAPLDEVARHAAVHVIQRWVGLLRPHLPDEGLELAVHTHISQLVWQDGQEKLEGHLGRALQNAVPPPNEVGKEQWEYLQDLLETDHLQAQLDMTSPVHARIPSSYKLAARCGMEPKVWVPGPAVSDMPRSNFLPKSGCRLTVSNLSREQMAAVYTPTVIRKVPGPGHYDTDRVLFASAINRPARGEFHPVGKSRARCLVNQLETSERIL